MLPIFLALLTLLASPLLLGQDSALRSPTLSNDQIRDLIRQAAGKDVENDKKQRDYTYVEREEEHKRNGKGEVASSEIRTYDVMMLYGEQVRRLVSKNDRPLPEKDAAKEEEKIQKSIDKRKNEGEDDRRKRLEKEEKQRADDRKFVGEVADAYNFRLVGVESMNGRDTFVIDADPRPGFQPKLRDAKMLPNFRFRVWIDKAESQWVKLDIQCIETASFGWILARVHKGSNITIELTRVNQDVWLPKHVALKLDARIALFKGLNIDEDVTYRDYKKFRTDIRILPLGESKE
ncbi:MAG TPA: hypothetical protein VK641_07080 [Terriglobales bacterium]|jgi:hypothetical protein|nr:hypothetical protein [Terriglobales bacterium]